MKGRCLFMNKFMMVLFTIGGIIMLCGFAMFVGSIMQYVGVIPCFMEFTSLYITSLQALIFGGVIVAIPMGYYTRELIEENTNKQ